MTATLTIGAIAQQAEVSTKTVRYYESIGLLQPDSRGENGYRYYSREAVNRLAFIRRAKTLGLTLDEIGGLLALSADAQCDIVTPELQRVLNQKLAECDRILADISAFRSQLASVAAKLEPCASDDACGCGSTRLTDCGCLPVPENTAHVTPLDIPLRGKPYAALDSR